MRTRTYVADLPGWEPSPEGASVGDLAYDLEALGVSPDGFVRVLALADSVTRLECPAALSDVSANWRVGVKLMSDTSGTSGDRMGSWRGRWVLIWRKTESDYRRERGGK